MPGVEKPADKQPVEWFDLVDIATEQVVGQITRHGDVRNSTPDVVMKITAAYDREIMIEGNALTEELGVCFANVETVQKQDAAHDDLVFRNLGLLAGLIPRNPQHGKKAE